MEYRHSPLYANLEDFRPIVYILVLTSTNLYPYNDRHSFHRQKMLAGTSHILRIYLSHDTLLPRDHIVSVHDLTLNLVQNYDSRSTKQPHKADFRFESTVYAIGSMLSRGGEEETWKP